MAKRQFTKYLFETPSVTSGEEAEVRKEDFVFEKKLGEGAFGRVWRARHCSTNRVFAIKEVPKAKVLQMLPQFKREVFIMYQLSHPHIVKLHSHFEDETAFFLIMEIMEGGNLFHRLYREKQFYEQQAAQYFREVVLAVEYLHCHLPAIIHRDIKPENILLDSENRAKVTDFGWSNYYNADTAVPRMTVCGTLEYLPPEIVEKRGHGPMADIWCLGVLLFEMLVGYTPFKSKAKSQLLTNIAAAKLKFPLSFPPLAKDLITHMLAKSPAARLTIAQVKAHRWLVETPPLRATLVQSLDIKVLTEPEEGRTVPGYTVIASKARLSTADTKTEESEFRSSDEKPSKKLISSPLSLQTAKQDLSVLQTRLNSVQSLLASQETRRLQLQGAVQAAIRLKEALKRSETELRSELALKRTAVERGRSSQSQTSVSHRVLTATSLLSSKTGQISLLTTQLNRLKEDFSSQIADITAKEETISALNAKLAGVKQDLKEEKANFHSRTTDLHMNIALLRCQIEGRSKFVRELDPNDQLLIHQMHQLSKNKVDLLVFKRSKAVEMSEMVEKMQEKCGKLEGSAALLRQNWDLQSQEMERWKERRFREIEADFKGKKAEIGAKRAALRESLRLQSAQEAAKTAKTSFFPADNSTALESLQVPNRQELTQISQISRRQIDSVQSARARLKREMERNVRRIASREDELAQAKCAVLNFAIID